MLRIAPPEDSEPLRRMREDIGKPDWIILTSRHAVRALLEGVRVPKARRPRVAAVGESTAEAVRQVRWPVDLVAEGKGGGALAHEMIRQDEISGRALLYPRSNLARDDLVSELEAAGGRVTILEAYRTLPPDGSDPEVRAVLDEIRNGRFDVAVFASPSAVRHLAMLLPAGHEALRGLASVGIGKTTASALREHGASRVTEASRPDTAGLFQAVLEAWNGPAKGRTDT
jgi:uroporphyrinogen-III synthase